MAQKIQAGDIIRFANGREEYVFDCGDGILGTNACNESWIARGLREYGDECYPLTADEIEEAEVVGHLGNGLISDARKWRAGTN